MPFGSREGRGKSQSQKNNPLFSSSLIFSSRVQTPQKEKVSLSLCVCVREEKKN